jgi:CBS domain-containing protein
MVERNIGCLVVLGKDGTVDGILSERDYLEKIIVKGRSSKTTPVADIMSEKSLVSVTRESTLTECMELMTARRVRHLPVLDGDKVAGLVSIGDVVFALTESYKAHENLMKEFITGSYS